MLASNWIRAEPRGERDVDYWKRSEAQNVDYSANRVQIAWTFSAAIRERSGHQVMFGVVT